MRSRRSVLPFLWFLLLCLAVFVGGCAGLQRERPFAESDPTVILGEGVVLQKSRNIYVARTQVGEQYAKAAAAFGKGLEEICREALVPYASALTVGHLPETRIPALASARKAGARYLVIPSLYSAEILTYEQAPEARMAYFLSVFDAESGTHLSMRYKRVSADIPEAENALRQSMVADFAALFAATQGR